MGNTIAGHFNLGIRLIIISECNSFPHAFLRVQEVEGCNPNDGRIDYSVRYDGKVNWIMDDCEMMQLHRFTSKNRIIITAHTTISIIQYLTLF